MAPLQPTSLQQWQWQLQCQLTAAASETKGDENKINQKESLSGGGRKEYTGRKGIGEENQQK